MSDTVNWGDDMCGMRFCGSFAHTLDSKGRVTIPAAYREALQGTFTISLNNQFAAVALYPPEKWKEKCRLLAQIPESDIRGTRYVRLIVGNSFEGCELDAQGRVLIPAALRQKVGLNKEIRFVGMGQYLEIWDEERYMAESAQAEENIDDLLDYVNGQYCHSSRSGQT